MWEAFAVVLVMASGQAQILGDPAHSYASYLECVATVSDRLTVFDKPANELAGKEIVAMGCRKIAKTDERGA